MKSITVVIPNYNGEDLLRKNLPFIYSALQSSGIKNYEIIIPDDASKDNSIQFLENNYPDIVIIKNEINVGFSGNTNSGLKKASKDLVFIVNTDVQLTENYFTPLLPYFDIKDTFGVMGRIISLNEKEHQDGAKYPGYSIGNIISTENYYYDSDKPIYSFFLSGANSLVCRKKLEQLGYYNELFNPYYSEDADLGFRAWRVGFKLYYEHKAICKHPNSVTIKQESSNKIQFITKRNKMYLHYLHLNGIELNYYLFFMYFRSFFKKISGNELYYKSYKAFKKDIPKLTKYKEEFESKFQNVTSIKKVVNFIKGNIDSKNVNRF